MFERGILCNHRDCDIMVYHNGYCRDCEQNIYEDNRKSLLCKGTMWVCGRCYPKRCNYHTSRPEKLEAIEGKVTWVSS